MRTECFTLYGKFEFCTFHGIPMQGITGKSVSFIHTKYTALISSSDKISEHHLRLSCT
jgi:hypothetical protein